MAKHHLMLLLAAAASLSAGCANAPPSRSTARPPLPSQPTGPTGLARAQVSAATTEVIAAERAFAKTMADRDFKAFLALLSPDAIFFSGSRVEHGPAEIAAQWAPYFAGRDPPFAWQPDHVEVLPDGKLALSTGPMLQQGKIVGRFNSVWRLEGAHSWHIVFDKGEAVCGAPPPAVERDGAGLSLTPQ